MARRPSVKAQKALAKVLRDRGWDLDKLRFSIEGYVRDDVKLALPERDDPSLELSIRVLANHDCLRPSGMLADWITAEPGIEQDDLDSIAVLMDCATPSQPVVSSAVLAEIKLAARQSFATEAAFKRLERELPHSLRPHASTSKDAFEQLDAWFDAADRQPQPIVGTPWMVSLLEVAVHRGEEPGRPALSRILRALGGNPVDGGDRHGLTPASQIPSDDPSRGESKASDGEQRPDVEPAPSVVAPAEPDPSPSGPSQPAVYMSYAWGSDDLLIDELCESFVSEGIQVHRDSHDVNFCDALSQFMDELGNGRLVVAVISDKYLKSIYCMRELLSVYRKQQSSSATDSTGSFRDAIVFIVLEDADRAWEFPNNEQYLDYWDEQLQARRAAFDRRPQQQSPLRKRQLDLVRDFAHEVDNLLTLVGDFSGRSRVQHRSSDIEPLKTAIEERLSKVGHKRVSAERLPDAHRHELRLVLNNPQNRASVESWLMTRFASSSNSEPDAVAKEAEALWSTTDLQEKLYDVEALWDELVKQGLTGIEAEQRARSLIQIFVSLHPHRPKEHGALENELAESRRMRSPVAFELGETSLEALYGIQLALGPGIHDASAFLRAFYREIARRNPGWSEAFAEQQLMQERKRYAAAVKRCVYEGSPISKVRRPLYMVVPEDAEGKRLLDELRGALEGAAHTFRSERSAVVVSLEWAFRELHKKAGGVRARRKVRPRVFRWLHISDLHFGRPDVARDEVLDDLLTDASRLRERLGNLDAVLVTGGVTWSARPDEFESARRWLTDLAGAVVVDPARTFVVPGGHDIDCTDATSSYVARKMHELISSAPAKELKELPTELLQMIWPKFEPFVSFSAGLGGGSITYSLPFFNVRLSTGLGPVCVAGLNTALACAGDTSSKGLALGLKQVVDATKAEPDALLIILMHHPSSALDDGEALSQRLAKRAHLAFCGYAHEGGGEVTNQFGREQLWFRAGAAYDAHSQSYRFALGELSPEGLTQYPRVWSPHLREFVPDTSRFPLTHEANRTPSQSLPRMLTEWMRRD